MTPRTRRRGHTWFEEAVAHYLDRHPLADDRVTPRGAPAADLLQLAKADSGGGWIPLALLPRLPTVDASDPERSENALAALVVNYYAGVIARGHLVDVGELLAGMSGLSSSALSELEPGFRGFIAAFGDVATRLTAARDCYGRGLARLRSAHHKFFDVATAGRHQETARLHAESKGGTRRPLEADLAREEFLREAPARIERAFNAAITKLAQADRDAEHLPANLYDATRWGHLAAPAQHALEAVRTLRQEAESIASRASKLPRLRTAAADLRGAATYTSGTLEEALTHLRLPEQLTSALATALTGS